MSPKTKKILAIAAAIIGTITPLFLGGLEVYLESRSASRQADATESKAEAGYKTQREQFDELVDDMAEAHEWADETDETLDELVEQNHELERRVLRLEAYIDILVARSRYRIKEPVIEMDEPPEPRAKKSYPAPPAARLPPSLDAAKYLQQQKQEALEHKR